MVRQHFQGLSSQAYRSLDNPSYKVPYCYTTHIRTPVKPEVETFQRLLVDSFQAASNGRDAKLGMIDVQRNIIRLDTKKVMIPETMIQRYLRQQKLRTKRPLVIDRLVSSCIGQKRDRSSSFSTDNDQRNKRLCNPLVRKPDNILLATESIFIIAGVVKG